MNTNIIEITNEVIVTNTITMTNTLSKVDIMNIPTDWNVLGVTIFGALATAISACFMLWSVLVMRASKKEDQLQRLNNQLVAIYQEYIQILFIITRKQEKQNNQKNSEYYFQMLMYLNLACRIYFNIPKFIKKEGRELFNTMFLTTISIFMEKQSINLGWNTDGPMVSEYQVLLSEGWTPKEIEFIKKYCEKQNIQILEFHSSEHNRVY